MQPKRFLSFKPALLALCSASMHCVTSDAATSATELGLLQGEPSADALQCDAPFAAAIHIVVHAVWDDSLAFEQGEGDIHLWLHSRFNGDDTTSVDSRLCGTVTPEVQVKKGVGGYKVMLDIAEPAWDRPAMPHFQGSLSRVAGAWVLDPGALLLGATLSDPLTEWPDADELQSADHDADKHPGITAFPRKTGEYKAPPLQAAQKQRADQVYLATRAILTLSSTAQPCAQSSAGTVAVQAFEYAVLGCRAESGEPCTESQSHFLDNHRTDNELTTAAFKAQPISATASCADVRALLP